MESDFEVLSHKVYPLAAAVELHGAQPLEAIQKLNPIHLPVDDGRFFPRTGEDRFHAISWDKLKRKEVLSSVQFLADGFAAMEPRLRHLNLPKQPDWLDSVAHTDALGENVPFGEWSIAQFLYWRIRATRLTDLSDPAHPIIPEVLRLSSVWTECPSALQDSSHTEQFSPYVVQLLAPLVHPAPPPHDMLPILKALFSVATPDIVQKLKVAEEEGLALLIASNREFANALDRGKVALSLMLSKRCDETTPRYLPFKAFCESFNTAAKCGYEYVVFEATNPWTGAAAETVGCVPVFYAPYRGAGFTVPKSEEPIEGCMSSPSGFLSDKDTGAMFYVGKLPPSC